MESLVQAFLATCSPPTAAAYGRDLTLYLDHMTPMGVSLREIKRYHVMSFVDARHRAGDAPATVRRRLAAVGTFHEFLVSEGYDDASPVVGVTVPPSPRPGGPVVGLGELQLVWRRAVGDLDRHRDAMLAVVLLAGYRLRASDLPGVTTQTFDRAGDGWTFVHRGEAADVPDALRRLIPDSPAHSDVQYAVGGTSEPVARQTIGRWIRELADTAGIAGPFGPRVLRRSAPIVAMTLGISPADALAPDWFALPRERHPVHALAAALDAAPLSA